MHIAGSGNLCSTLKQMLLTSIPLSLWPKMRQINGHTHTHTQQTHALPSDGILCLFLYQPDALQHISDVIDTTLLSHIQHVSCL